MTVFRSTRMAGALAWAVLLSAIIVALLYLNSAAASAWAGSGPPTTVPEAWMQRAFAHLCYATGAQLIGFGAFRVIRRLPGFDRMGLVLALFAIIAVAVPRIRGIILVRRCVDAGGRWDGAAFRCDG